MALTEPTSKNRKPKGKPLTELALKNLKPENKRYLVCDYEGLYIEVNPTGRKYWKVRYMVDGKARKITLGEYPYITLKDARQKRDEVRGVVITGEEPPAPQRTFRDVAGEWYKTHIENVRTERHAETVISRLERFLYPKLGDKIIRDISAPEVLGILKALQDSGIVETAHRVKLIAGQVFRYAIAIGEGERDVTADLRGALRPSVSKNHATITKPLEIKALIRAMDDFQGSTIVKQALRFSILTFQRPGEIRRAEWAEIDFDAAEWRIPAEKMKKTREKHKNDDPHIVPLSTQAQEIIQNMKNITGHGRYIFPSNRTLTHGERPMSENTVVAALRRLGYTGDEMTAHGFRHMASTRLNEARNPGDSRMWDKDAIERQLDHGERDRARGTYNRAE